MKKSYIFTLCGLGLVAFLFATANRAQTADQQHLVKLNLIVVDRSNHSVDDLQKEDLELFDNATQQAISYFAREESAAKYGIVIDTSGSLRTQFPAVKASVAAIIQANRPDDLTFIIRFISSDKIKLVHVFTSDKFALTNAINGLSVEPGQTALIDGLYTAAEYAIKNRTARERLALVLVSDGEDRASYYSEATLLKLLHENDIQVFAIGLISALDPEEGFTRSSAKRKATEFLARLAKETGGRAFPIESPNDLPEAVAEIQHDLHSQYVIGYQPTGKPDQTRRKIQIKVINDRGGGKRKAITRPIVTINPTPAKSVDKQP